MKTAKDFTVGVNADATPVIFSYDQAAKGNSSSDEAEKKRSFDTLRKGCCYYHYYYCIMLPHRPKSMREVQIASSNSRRAVSGSGGRSGRYWAFQAGPVGSVDRVWTVGWTVG